MQDASGDIAFKSPTLSVETSLGIRLRLTKLGATRDNRPTTELK
jgi:hypothetical protein